MGMQDGRLVFRHEFTFKPFEQRKCSKCSKKYLGLRGKYCVNCNPDYQNKGSNKYPKALLSEAQQMDILDLQWAIIAFNQRKVNKAVDFEEEKEKMELSELRQRIYNKYVSEYEKAPRSLAPSGGPGIVQVGSSTSI